jgi:catechol 2,3-dioxygenase-like lactoylglutathione lyase family enzyme
MLSGLNHLTLAVSQLAPSVAFYQQLLGMTLHARWDSGPISPAAICGCACRWIRSGASLRRKRATTPTTRLALRSRFRRLRARLETAGVAVWKVNRSEGASHYFLDPDGHKLELHVGSLAQRLAACREQPYKGMVFYDE